MKEAIIKLTSDHIKVKGAEYVQDLVRCKECKWFDEEDFICFYNSNPSHIVGVDETDFCSCGEVRDE